MTTRIAPNVIYINSHDMGRYIQPYGYPVVTPNLQRFAEDAVVFRNAFCTNPTCSPSRAGLLTGMTPHSNGMLGLAHLGWQLNDYTQHWVHRFHELGYQSHFIGGQHISGASSDGMTNHRKIGYQNIIEGFGASGWANAMVEFVTNQPKQPFYVEIGFNDCHRFGSYFQPANADDDPRWVRSPACLPDYPRTRAEFAGYRSQARRFDHLVGQILGALDHTGIADNTIVVLTTDHGIDFPHMKGTLRDDGLGVFLMIRGPRNSPWRGGKLIDALVSHLDVYPTLCELTGAKAPPWLQGKSLSPLVSGEAKQIHDEIFAEMNYHAAYQPMRCVRTQRWKYIKRLYDWMLPIASNEPSSHSRDVLEEHDWFNRPQPREELFDLIYDVGEEHNLAGDPGHTQVLADLRGRLDKWMHATDDPLLRGHIPLVKGGRVMSWDQTSNMGPWTEADAWNTWLKAHESRPLNMP